MTIIVSAIISNINNNRGSEKYYEYGKQLLSVDAYKIFFLDEIMIRLIKPEDYDPKNTLIVPFNKKEIYLYEYEKHLTRQDELHRNKDKDTNEFLFVQCHKTEWIRKAIEISPFPNPENNFTWIDFGIFHVMSLLSSDEFKDTCSKLKNYDNIRIGHIFNYGNVYFENDPYWFFAGGVFGGHADKLIIFADKMKQICIKYITSKNKLVWEVNLWYFIYKNDPSIFSLYQCDHNDTIISNY